MTNLDTDEHLLSSSMHHRVDLLSPDLDRLVGVATVQGGRIRRRRRAAVGIAAAACVGLGGVALASLPLGSPSDNGPATDPSSASPAVVPETSETRARSLAAALLERVQAAVPGAGSAFRGQDDHELNKNQGIDPRDRSAYAEVRFTPSTTDRAAWINLGVQAPSLTPRSHFTCAARAGSGKYGDGALSSCVRTEVDGTVVLTWDEVATQADGSVLVTRKVDAIRADDVRVYAQSSNTPELSDHKKGPQVHTVTGDPALTAEQLRDLVTWPTWGMQLPASYDALGAELEPFDDLSQTGLEGTPIECDPLVTDAPAGPCASPPAE